MVTERIQQRIDRLLDAAEAAVDAAQWGEVDRLCAEVLALDPDDASAEALRRVAAHFSSSDPQVEARRPNLEDDDDARAPRARGEGYILGANFNPAAVPAVGSHVPWTDLIARPLRLTGFVVEDAEGAREAAVVDFPRPDLPAEERRLLIPQSQHHAYAALVQAEREAVEGDEVVLIAAEGENVEGISVDVSPYPGGTWERYLEAISAGRESMFDWSLHARRIAPLAAHESTPRVSRPSDLDRSVGAAVSDWSLREPTEPMRLSVHWLRFIGLLVAVVIGMLVFGFISGVVAILMFPDMTDASLESAVRGWGVLIAIPLTAWAASRVGMTGWWGLLILIPIVGTIGVVRIIWRWSGDRDDYALS